MSNSPSTTARQKLSQLASKIGLDERVASGLTARLIPMSAGPISSFITVWTLTKETQGLFYLFGSLVALRSLFELGAGTSVMQVAAHARQKGEDKADSPLEPAFVATVNRWMTCVAVIFGVVVAGGGSAYLIYHGHGDGPTLAAWLGFLGISVFQFSSEGRWGLLQGSDRMVEANRLRLRNSLIQYGTQWTLLLSGAGLFAFVGSSIAAFVSQEIHFRRHFKWLYAKRADQSIQRLAHFRSELATLIRRASQTYLTSYFVFQIQGPICFQHLGADGLVRFGFTATIGGMLIGLSSLWVAMNFPRIAHDVADGHTREGWLLFRSRYIQTIVLSLCGAVAAWGFTRFLTQFPRFAERLMDSGPTAILYLGLATQASALAMTYWPRAFKVEPFVRVAYLQMFVTPALLWVLTSTSGLQGAAWGILGSWILGLAGILMISRKYWNFEESNNPTECSPS
jgi:hypothetical protein